MVRESFEVSLKIWVRNKETSTLNHTYLIMIRVWGVMRQEEGDTSFFFWCKNVVCPPRGHKRVQSKKACTKLNMRSATRWSGYTLRWSGYTLEIISLLIVGGHFGIPSDKKRNPWLDWGTVLKHLTRKWPACTGSGPVAMLQWDTLIPTTPPFG